MTDIATLGIAVDSRQAATASSNLDKLAASGKTAQAASTALTKATNDTATSHAGLSGQAQAAAHSVRSMVESLAIGTPVTQVLSQQISHLSYAATGPGGLSAAFKQAGGAILGLLSPTALVVGGLAAVGAAGYLAYAALSRDALAFDDVSRSIGTTIGQLKSLQAAAGFKGISQDDFFKSIEKFGDSVYQAQNNMGGLATVFRANNVQASTFNDYLYKAADLIKSASDDQQRLQLLQQMGLPATMQWVRFLSQGADGIKAAQKAAGEFNDTAEGKLVASARAFDDAWNKATTNAVNYFKSWGLSAIDWISRVAAGHMSLARSMLPEGERAPTRVIMDMTGAGSSSGPKPVDPAVLQRQISLQQQYIGLLGQTASIQQVGTAVELQAQQARLSGVNISTAQVAKLKELAQENALGLTAIKASTDAQKLDADVVGMSVGQAQSYLAAQNAINQAKREGRPLTQDNIEAINREASALGQAAQRADDMKFAYEGFVRGPMQAFTQAIANGSKFFDALKAAGLSALNALSSKLADMAAQNLWKAALGGSTGGGGLLSLLGFGGGAGTAGATGGAGVLNFGAAGSQGVLTFADGGYTGAGGKYQPAGIVHRGEYVMDAATTSRLGIPFLNSLRGYADGGFVDSAPIAPPRPANSNAPSGSVTITIPQNLYFYGSDPASEARMRAYVDQNSKATIQEAVRQVAQVKGSTPAYLRGGR